MHHRKMILAAAVVAVATFAAGILAAQTLDQAATETLGKDGAVTKQAKDLKASIAQHDLDLANALKADEKIKAEAGHGGGHEGGHHDGGHHDGGRGGERGDHRGDHRGDGDHRGGHEPHGDWGRWHGHPGWGYGRGWIWRDGRWWWPGWVIWRGVGRVSCVGYYNDRFSQCNNSCAFSNTQCMESCGGYNDASCAEACSIETNNCYESCGWRRDQLFMTCPAF